MSASELIPPSGSPTEDTAENRLKETLFVVEATSTEQFMLWKDYSNGSDSPRYPTMSWKQVNPGWLVTVGKIGDRPCCISVTWNRINGRLVMFWHQCSQVTDSLQSEAWINANFEKPHSTCDAMNFHICVRAINAANTKESHEG
jgi:hypothetical protein